MPRLAAGLVANDDGKVRCWWCQADDAYRAYHDTEWGYPVTDDRRLFEKFCLEGFQAGLSWLTILRRREGFRKAFANFEYEAVARFNERSVQRLLQDPGIIRHRGKIEATINNARRAAELVQEFGSISAYLWRFEPDPKTRPRKLTYDAVRTFVTSPESIALARDMKRRGWKFLGPTTLYAHMQAMGMVNDHIHGCHVRPLAEAARKELGR
ncbi:MAG TPA: DNA-3-methyladenine glycosylase I [Gemmatimonadales bacterium]|nr:DNA-3-methyladenine glycosylase I [Gemmatimonadales bacterium]